MPNGSDSTDARCQIRCVHPQLVAKARARLEDAETYRQLAEVFAALADPTRARIVHTLLSQELCTCDIAVVVGVSESGVSQHLRILRSLRLVKSRREGKFVYYTLDDAHISSLVQIGLAHVRHPDDLLVDDAVGREGAV